MAGLLLPIQKSESVVNATDLACMIIGQNDLTISGFRGPSVITPWQRQTIRVVPPDMSDTELIHELRRQGNSNRWLWIGVASMITTGIVFLSLTTLMVDRRDLPLSPIDWRVTAISDKGLSLKAGTSDVTIPVGAQLPNGEALLATSKATNTFTTEIGTTHMESKK